MKLFSLFTTTFIGGAGTALYFGVSGNKGKDSNGEEKGPETLDGKEEPPAVKPEGDHSKQEDGGEESVAEPSPVEPREEQGKK